MSPLPSLRRCVLLAVLVTTGALVALAGGAAIASSTKVLNLSAKGHMVLRFTTSHLRAHPGRVTLVMHNPSDSGMSHGIALTGHGVRKIGQIVGPGHVSRVSATVKRGSYTFFCPVPGHEAAGMRGTLTVS